MRITKKIYVPFVSLLVAVGALVALNVTGTTTQAVSSYRDCAEDTIIKCGAVTEAELLQHYDNNDGDVQHIYSHYGISRNDIAGKTSGVEIVSGTVYQDGRVVVGNNTVATDAYSVSRLPFSNSDGEAPRTVTINGTKLYEGPDMSIFVRPVDAFVFMKDGQFYKAILSACGNPLIATPKKTEVQPVMSCDSLKANKIDRTKFEFTTVATAKNGAEVVSYTYNFGDSNTQTYVGATADHTYSKPGTYTVTVTVNIKVNGSVKQITNTTCKTTVKVEAVPVKPLYACNSLTARIVKADTRTYEYTLAYTAEGGADLNKAVYDFGDNTSATFSKDKATGVQHSYAKAGSYRTVATLYFTVKNGTEVTEKSLSCEVVVNTAPEMCTMPGKENLPKNSPECAEKPELCTYPGKETLPKNSPECAETPTELPTTGMGDILSGGVGISSLTAAGYYWVGSRKHLLSKLLNK